MFIFMKNILSKLKQEFSKIIYSVRIKVRVFIDLQEHSHTKKNNVLKKFLAL